MKWDQKSKDSGDNAVNLFEKECGLRGIKYEKSSYKEDVFDHFDYHLYSDSGKSYKVEIKARKRIKRSDANTQDACIWIEFKNVVGKDGWLYGKADYIVFECEDEFIFVNRLKLVTLAEKLVNFKEQAKSSSAALYKVYTRFGRKDLVSMIKLSDLNPIIKTRWKKGE